MHYAGGFLYNPRPKEILLHKRDWKTDIHPGQWAFFGGLSEGSETPGETFRRELKEEIGIDIRPAEVLPLCDYFNSERGTPRYVFYVESELDKSDMKLGEGADFDWIPLSQLFEYDLTDKTRSDLELFLRKIKNGRN